MARLYKHVLIELEREKERLLELEAWARVLRSDAQVQEEHSFLRVVKFGNDANLEYFNTQQRIERAKRNIKELDAEIDVFVSSKIDAKVYSKIAKETPLGNWKQEELF